MKLTPVDYDPFADEAPQSSAKPYTLTPVDYDPFADEAPPAPATPARGFGSELGRQVALTARHGAEGVADLLGLVVDPFTGLVNKGLEAAGVPGRGLGIRDAVSRVADAVGLPKPENDRERWVGKATAGVAGAASPIGVARKVAEKATSEVGKRVADAFAGTVAAPAKTSGATSAGAGRVRQFAQKVSNQVTDKVGGAGARAQIGADAAQAVGGGAAGAAGEMVRQDGGNEVEQFLASFVAGMTPAAAAASLRALRAGLAGEHWFTAGRERQAAEKLKKLVKPGQEGNLVQILDQAIAKGEVLPGSAPTTAQAISKGSPGNLADDAFVIERTAAEPQAIAREAQRDAVRKAALDELAPQGDPNALSEGVQARVQRLMGIAQASQARRTQTAQARLAQAGAPIQDAHAGDAIRAVDDRVYEQARGRTSDAYNDPRLQAMETELPVEQIDEIMARYYGATPELADPKLRQLAASTRRLSRPEPVEPSRLILPPGVRPPAPAEPAIPRVPFRDIQNLRAAAGSLANEAGRDGATQTSSAAGEMKRALSDIPPGRGATPEQIELYQKARATRADQGERFETGPLKALRQTGSDGAPQVAGAEIPKKFFHTGDSAREDATRFMKAYGDQPQAIETARRYIVQQLRDQATDANGVIDAVRLNRWVDAYRPALEAVDPSLIATMRRVQNAQRLADSAGARQVRWQRDIDRSALGLVLRSDTPEHAVEKAMTSKSALHDLRQLAHQVRGDRDAVNGLRRAMIDFVQTKADKHMAKTPGQTGPTLGQAGFSRALKTYDSKLRQVFSEEELAVMRRVSEDLEQGALSVNAHRGGGSDTQPKLSMASTLSGLLVPGSGAVTGALGTVRDWLLTGSRQEVKRLFQEALMDPTFARDLAKRASESEAKKLLPRLQQLGNRFGFGASTMATSDLNGLDQPEDN